ncbi:hypothetical protein VII00023_22959 [Vibrio ichthyoenteri ATCC 700023]|uniref:Lipoprotein n=1 Tax=Vibrio ichthyoenteri ATCC 700023 TaxID=870968 RepID=F9S7J7_9VIBR|nr:hypothetical protein [Vibrio ichthyoenteri]EGU31293.1 hypothetical protein VII00023_22959 [Vibrio ichthyoenteri ATCC 700023]
MKTPLMVFIFATLTSLNANSTAIPCAGCGAVFQMNTWLLATENVRLSYQNCVDTNGKQNEKCKILDEIKYDTYLEASKIKPTTDKTNTSNIYKTLKYKCIKELGNEHLKCRTLSDLVDNSNK